MSHFHTPNGVTCPLIPGQFCEIHWADGSVFRGVFFYGEMGDSPCFTQGRRYRGRRFDSSWDWRRDGICVPVRRYRVIGDEAMETLRNAAQNPEPVRVMTGACDALPHRAATRGTFPGGDLLPAAGGFSGECA